MKNKIFVLITLPLILLLSVVYPAFANDYLKIDCLPEAQTFTIDSLFIYDDIAFNKSPDDWGKKILNELREHNIYPAYKIMEVSCHTVGNYKFEIIFAGPEPKYKYGTRKRLWKDDKLLLDIKESRMLDNTTSSNHFESGLSNIGVVNITHIAIDRMGNVLLTLNKWEKDLNKAPIFLHSEKTVNINVIKSSDDKIGWPITDTNIESIITEENK